jgi:hypothetical protein
MLNGDEMNIPKGYIFSVVLAAIALILLAFAMPATLSAPDRVELLYFHRTERCQSCINAEQFARDTIETYFPEELKSGILSMQSIDYQKNAEIAGKYNVKMQGLKLRIVKDGIEVIKDVPEIWAYVKDRNAYMGYLKGILEKEMGR